MNIIYIEPYLANSHQSWYQGLKKHSKHSFDILSLPANKWKWRMHGGAITLANMFNELKTKYDLIICSDFLNLPVFRSLTINNIKQTPIVIYFHENQASYPWPSNDKDVQLERDFHYYYINQTSSLCSSWNFFNSEYHLNSYIEGLSKYLSKMPDYKNKKTLDMIISKSSVLHLGCNLSKLDHTIIKGDNDKPLILWNHRWEYDKNPELFFKILKRVKSQGFEFELALLGERFTSYPQTFKDSIAQLNDNIVVSDYCSPDAYKEWLINADILPVTSNQDFFGISIMEAIYCNTHPILPNRLAYKELYNNIKNKEFFYDNDNDLFNKTIQAIKNYKNLKGLSDLTKQYDWNQIISKYDSEFEEILSNN